MRVSTSPRRYYIPGLIAFLLTLTCRRNSNNHIPINMCMLTISQNPSRSSGLVGGKPSGGDMQSSQRPRNCFIFFVTSKFAFPIAALMRGRQININLFVYTVQFFQVFNYSFIPLCLHSSIFFSYFHFFFILSFFSFFHFFHFLVLF